MNNIYKSQFKLPVSLADNNGRLSIPSVFYLCCDLATYHAAELKVGLDILGPKGLFWLAVKTKIKIHRLPSMMENIEAITWPEAPNRIRCNRYYAIKSGEELLIEGKTEWAVIDINTNRLQKVEGIYPEELVHLEDTVCDEPYEKFNLDFKDGKDFGSYTVKSTDIDVGNHMNNAAYARAFISLFTCEEINKMNIKEVEITYKAPCFEGENLTVKRIDTEDAIYLAMLHNDSSLASAIKLTF
ncbi:MAG: hypothetical protein IJZ75_03575 [Clostridia bacterium]|nr:hypothetical protein [Clostridia bacterium]